MTDWDAMAKGNGRDWYLAASLVALGNEINHRWPHRDDGSDGAIGDASHQARVSDHNPDWSAGGVVRAIDVDDDGINVQELLDALIGDERVWYVIWDRHIYSRTYDWDKQAYDGPDPHTGHLHVSINHTRAAETNTSAWFGTSTREDVLNMGEISESRLREIIADELNKQDRALWASATGTGKKLVIDKLAGIGTAVQQIKDKLK